MASVRLAAPLAAVFILLAPSAAAAAATGELAAGQVLIPEAGRIESIGLDLLSVSASPPQLQLTLTDAALQRIGRAETHSSFPSATFNEREINERASFARAVITLSPGEGDQIVALRTLGPTAATVGPSAVKGVAAAFLASALQAPGVDGTEVGEPGSCRDRANYCLDVFGAYEIAGDAIGAQIASGEFLMLLYGPTLIVEADGESAEYASGPVSFEEAGPTISRREDAWVVIRASDATGSIAAAVARLYSAAPTVRASVVEFEDADGSVRVGARDYRATSDDIVAEGALVLAPGPVAAAQDYGPDNAPVYASSFTTRISGDVDSINLNAKPVFLDTAAKQAGFAALLAILIGGIAYAWQHISFFGAALYTRLNKPDILDNEVRNRIYAIIRENPGISAREVHRRSEQSWGTVVYHLRQLERHHLVVSRSLGRTRNYYENHGKYRGMEVQLACLQSERARTLARAIAATPGITQEQLAAASGYPQPTTSYYVRKLKQAGLVEEQREGRYAKYVPHADLPRFIALSERAVDVGASAATGVQA